MSKRILWVLGIAAAILAMACLAPWLGLGEREGFFFFRSFGWRRSSVAALGLALGMAAALAQLAGWITSRHPGLRSELGVGAVVSLFLVVLVAGSAELYLALRAPFARVHWTTRFDAAYGWSFEPGEPVHWTNHVDFWTVHRANSLGFLDREPPASKTPGVCRILFLGDSFVEAAQVPIEEKLQVVFEELARAGDPSLAVETVALGYSGTGQVNQLAFYDHFGAKLEPDVVVLVLVTNDLANNSALLESVRNGWHPLHPPRLFFYRDRATEGFRALAIDPDWRDKGFAAPISRPGAAEAENAGLHRRLHAGAHERSFFYRWLFAQASVRFPSFAAWLGAPSKDRNRAMHRDWIEGLPGFRDAFAGWSPPEDPGLDLMFFAEPMPSVFQEAVHATGHALDQYALRSRDQGFQLLALASHGLSRSFAPARGSPGPELVDGKALELFAELLRERNIPLIDQREEIEIRGGSTREARFSRDGHWSEQGHRWAAQALLRYFRAHPEICADSGLGAKRSP